MTTDKKNIQEQFENITDHEYDGIKELDNPPPRWIMILFYITIGFSIIYGAYYFWLGVGAHQDEEYAIKSEIHDEKYQVVSMTSNNLEVLTDPADIAEGKQVYQDMNCFACHGMLGEGNVIGPNLTDDYYLHGCDIQSIFNVIKNGNPSKGMTAFKNQISDDKIHKVASYIITLHGSNPANSKAPQGEKCE